MWRPTTNSRTMRVRAKIDHERVVHDRSAIEKYLRKIKGGCDFITENIDVRQENRNAEKSSLENAKEELYSTPAYKRAKAEEEKLAMGECAEKCMPDEKLETPE